MTEKIVKTAEVSEEGITPNKIPKEILENLRSRIVILNPEQSEIAQKLGIKEKGVYGTRFR
jgi:RNA polymerase subunit RPABC4/transcription elongation factor Spt4